MFETEIMFDQKSKNHSDLNAREAEEAPQPMSSGETTFYCAEVNKPNVHI